MSRHADAQVILATCTNLAEAAAVRSLLGAHDIHVVISGEQHQHAFGGLLGTAVSLDVRVAAGAAERATELIAELRRRTGAAMIHHSHDRPSRAHDWAISSGVDSPLSTAKSPPAAIIWSRVRLRWRSSP